MDRDNSLTLTQPGGGASVRVDVDRVAIDDLESQLLALGELLLDETALPGVIAEILDVGAGLLGDDPALSLTISAPGDPRRRFFDRGATRDWARALTEWQYEHGEGPCLAADEERRTCVVRSLEAAAGRHPGFAAVAREHGVEACVAFPIVVDGESLGSINAFYERPVALDERLLSRGQQLARAAAPLLANWMAHMRVRRLADQLTEALEGRTVIERAKGLLMGRLDIGDDEAFDLLRRQSQHENTKLREIAAALLSDHHRG